MSNRLHSSSMSQLFILALALLFCCGFQPAFAQDWVGRIGGVQANRSPNPKTNEGRIQSKRLDKRSKTPEEKASSSPSERLDEKQGEIEQEIEQGNQARDKNDYKQALAHYQRVFRDLSPKEARSFYGMGNVYADLYCYDSAIAAYRNALELKNNYLEALVGLGYAYAGKERYDEAREQFQKALDIKRDSTEANIGLGQVYAIQQKYDEAIALINLVINNKSIPDKDRAAAHLALGELEWRRERWPEAMAQFEKAMSLTPQQPTAYLYLGNTQLTAAYTRLSSFGYTDIRKAGMQYLEELHASARQATANLERARERKFDHPNLNQSLAVALAYQFRFQDASTQLKVYFDKVKELEDRLLLMEAKCDVGFNRLKAEFHWYSGYIYYFESEFTPDGKLKAELIDKAVDQFNQAIILKQDYPSAYGMLGNIYSAQDKNEEALDQFKKALLFETRESSKASRNLVVGSAYARLKRLDEALVYVREAIRLKPTEASYYETLASIYVAQNKIEETIAALNKANALRTGPAINPGPYYYLGTTYAIRFLQGKKDEDFNESLKWLKKAIEIRPDHVFSYNALGAVYEAHSNADEALANYKKASENDPKNPEYYFSMAGVYYRLKDNDDAAIGLLKQTIELKPDHARAYWQLGQVYYHKKDVSEAIRQLLNAIKYDSKYLQAYLDLSTIYKVQKDYPKAIEYLNRSIEVAPTDYFPYKELAKIHEEMRKNDEAIHYYREAMNRLEANDSSTRNLYLGRMARLKGQYAEAIELFGKVNYPDEPGQKYFEIGVTYIIQGDKRAALEQHKQLVQLKSALADELLKKIKEMK